MKITHFCNSFIAVEEGATRLLCDPWIGTCNYGGWLSYPISGGAEALFARYRPTHLYISHFHHDHFSQRTLEKLPDKGIPVFIKNFAEKVLLRRLNAAGFTNVVELPPWEPARLSDELEVAIVPADSTTSDGLDEGIGYDIDTSLLARSLADGTTFFNTVDNPMTLAQFRRVREFASSRWNGKVDVACIAVGAASEFPQCFVALDRETEQERVIASSLEKFSRRLEALGNEAYFPAGGSYIIPGKFSALNRFIAQPTAEQLRKTAAASGTCRDFFDIEGGSSIARVDGRWVRKEGSLDRFGSKADSISAHRELPYEYAELPDFEARELEALFGRARERYFEKLESLSVPVTWTVTFQLYRDLRIGADGRIVPGTTPFQTLRLQKDGSQAPPNELVCHLDHRLLGGLLSRKCVWNLALSGSIILYERTPNVHIPDIPFSLNYLTA